MSKYVTESINQTTDFRTFRPCRPSSTAHKTVLYAVNEAMSLYNIDGEQLLDFCAVHDLIVSNTWFLHKPVHQLTWYRNGDRSKAGHLIDLVLVNLKF